jgi:hypothetical protein
MTTTTTKLTRSAVLAISTGDAIVGNGLALAGLGYSLWRGQRTAAGRSLPSVRSSRLDPAGAE